MSSPRTYGHWRKPQAPGIGRLSGALTVGVFALLILMVLVQIIAGIIPALVLGSIGGSLGLLFARKDVHGVSLAGKIGERMRFWRSRRRGENLYRSGPLGVTGGAFLLPGVLAPTNVADFVDGFGRDFAVITTGRAGTFAVVFACESEGASLVTQDQVDTWVARWGQFLARLGEEPGLVGASVVVESAPDTGSRLQREISTHQAENIPALAEQMLSEVADIYPYGSASLRAYVTLTFENHLGKGTSKTLDIEEAGLELATRLPSLSQALTGTGAGFVRPLDAAGLGRVVRLAYDPGAQEVFDDALASSEAVTLGWNEVGPSATQANWDNLVHDNAVSVSWVMSAAPRGIVQSNILASLLAPSPRIARKRVALLYRPIEAGRAGEIVEKDKNAASVRVSSSANVRARDEVALAHAVASAAEEAAGAGLENFGMVITATTTSDAGDVKDTVDAVGSLASSARIRIRKCYGGQDAAFAISLPLGIMPGRYSVISESVREAL
ncbi:SCO6880 family protein [Actinotignum timonense]|uniref:SCO6880 family protein n=1 Tax=Actinotignum timonense TaxID=1870995 RepID=UPI002A805246|nr:SCO6880 family protein [Actinotignum timonense]MDY5137771.1 SCO6880 family protein [Actinotignum timonense]